ncbi:MAG: DNA-directed RNA polymerase subunit N [Methanomicrobiales archaeon]|nr:DNA-directed RNA polymerase subunit N [Methanomicrobiales archaeon]
MIPVRCFTCGKVIYPKRILDDLDIERYCCRRMFLTHKEIIDDLNPYQ